MVWALLVSHIKRARRKMRRSRWAKIGKKFENGIDNITHAIMVYRHFEERERNIEKVKGERHKFCEPLYIESEPQF